MTQYICSIKNINIMSLQIENNMNYSILQGFIFELSKLSEAFNILNAKLESLSNGSGNGSTSNKLYYNNKEVMEACGITANTLKEWRARGILKGKKLNGIWLYKTEDVLKLVD